MIEKVAEVSMETIKNGAEKGIETIKSIADSERPDLNFAPIVKQEDREPGIFHYSDSERPSECNEPIWKENTSQFPEPIIKGESTTIFGEKRPIPCVEVEHKQISDAPLSETELTMDEKIDKQNQAIESVESGEKSLETTQEKGNYGEMKTDQDLRERGYERISTDMVTDLDDAGHQGIDGVYYNPDGKPQYVIVDAKYGTAQLSETADGKQMSENWIDKRLDEAVGKERADEIRFEKLLDSDNVGSYIAHVNEDGTVTYDRLDENANVIEKDVKL